MSTSGSSRWSSSRRRQACLSSLQTHQILRQSSHITTLQPDLILSFYYRRLLCQAVLAIPRLGAINLHGSLLPKYRGRAPVNWVLVNGETHTGVTLHYMVRRPMPAISSPSVWSPLLSRTRR